MLAAHVITGVVSPTTGVLPSSHMPLIAADDKTTTSTPQSSTISVIVEKDSSKGNDSDANPVKAEKVIILF